MRAGRASSASTCHGQPRGRCGSVGGTSVSFAGSSGDRRLSGVADGIAANDAATVGQMTAGNAATLAAANNYTDNSLASLTGDIDNLFSALSAQNKDLRSELDAAAAGSAALAGMPQAFVPGTGHGRDGRRRTRRRSGRGDRGRQGVRRPRTRQSSAPAPRSTASAGR